MLDISLGDGGTFFGLWNPQSRSVQLRASIPPSHRALRGSVDDKYTSRAPKAPSALYLIVAPLLAVSASHSRPPLLMCLLPHLVTAVDFQLQALNFSSACGALVLASFACGGPRRAEFWAASFGRLLLLHGDSRPARRAARTWRLRPARVSGSRRSVLAAAQGNAAAAAATAAAAVTVPTGRRFPLPRAA